MERWSETLPRFQAALARAGTPVEELALLVGDLLQPGLDLAPYGRQLDLLAAQVARRLAPGRRGRPVAEALVTTLYTDLGYRGNQGHYYDPLNSFLHRVLERRTGLPITLGIVYLAVGRRLGLELVAMGLPGHFMVGYPAADGLWLLDAFHGQVLAEEDVGAYLGKLFGQAVALHRPLAAYRLSPRETVLRVLNNLRAIYLAHRDFPRIWAILHYLVAVAPARTEFLRERGLVAYHMGRLVDAQRDLVRYFIRQGRSPLLWARNGTDAVSGARTLPGRPFQGAGALEPDEDESALLGVLDEIHRSLAQQN